MLILQGACETEKQAKVLFEEAIINVLSKEYLENLKKLDSIDTNSLNVLFNAMLANQNQNIDRMFLGFY